MPNNMDSFMIRVLQVHVAIVLGALCYVLYNVLQKRRKLAWIPLIKGYPIIGNILDFQKSTEYHEVFDRYSKQYDGLVQVTFFTNRMLLVNNYEFLEFVLSSTEILNKTREYKFLHKWLGTGLLTAPGPKWKTSRKIITPAFHFPILEQFIDVFEDNGKILVDMLKKQCDKEFVNIYPLIKLCTLDIICETAMGVSINAQTSQYSDYIHAVEEMCRITLERTFSIVKMFDLLYPFTSDYWKERKCVKILHEHTNSVIQAKRKALRNKIEKDKNDLADELGRKKKMAFLDLLFRTTENCAPMTDERIREEVDTFMFGGHDTTASGISFTLYCLANHPDVQELAVAEQKSIFATDNQRKATSGDLREMKYLEMVIKETLRIYPSVPFFTRLTDKEVPYKDGKVIPAGVPIIIFAFGMNRNPKYYLEPHKFNPNRFEKKHSSKPYSYIPFSAGPRNCIGQKFAMIEMKSIISKVLRNFKLCTAGQEQSPILAAETILISSNGINLKLEKRTWD